MAAEDQSRSEALAAAIERRIEDHVPVGSLASDAWEIEPSDVSDRVDIRHRDTVARMTLVPTNGALDADTQLEVFAPMDREEWIGEAVGDVPDVTVAALEFPLLGEAVWTAEYYARNRDEYVPEDPVTDDVVERHRGGD